MKNTLKTIFALILLLTFSHLSSIAFAQGTAFTYQGQLLNNGNPANGIYNLQFLLYANSAGGTAVAGPVTNSVVAVTNGLFTVTIDLGSSVWNGQTNWLAISVETNNATSFIALAPRQQITPTPYAINAESLSGTLRASQLISTAGYENFYVGPAGNTNTSSGFNTALGVGALTSNNAGSYNTAIGDYALNVSAGNYNMACGNSALANNFSGTWNAASGIEALYYNTSGYQNTADGAQALTDNTIGFNNTAGGYDALYQNTTGANNTAMGAFSLYYNTSGSNNIAMGYLAGENITTGSSNIDIGNLGLSTDTNIIRIGATQGQTFIAGVIYGNGGGLTLNASQLTNTVGFENFYVGPAGNTNANNAYNTALGVNALVSNAAASYNTAIGCYALNANAGNYNMACGNSALADNFSGTWNAASGIEALYYNTSGYQNTADGAQALTDNTIGFNNTAGGYDALYQNTTGANNTAMGTFSLYYNTSGSNNIVLGFLAGENITTGSSNIDIGNLGVSTDNNLVRIGTTQTATYLVGTVYANGVALTSDRNAKEHFTPINARMVLDKVASLPITEWNYKTDTHAEHIGPMAQDFKAAFGLNGPDDKHISVVDEGGVALAAVQGLNQKLESVQGVNQKLESDNVELKRENNLLAKRLDELEAEVKTLAQNSR